MLELKIMGFLSSLKMREFDSYSEKALFRRHQKGSILIGLIITMVVMAALGAGMVSLTTTSTFNELFANNHARAYYAAEAGGRFALAAIREAYASDDTTKNTILTSIDNQTFTMSNNDQFYIIILSKNVNNPDTVTFTSTGTVNSGFLQAKRQIRYSIEPAMQSGGGGAIDPEQPLAISEFTKSGATASGEFDTVPNIDGGYALNVTHTTSERGNQPSTEAYVSPPGGNPNLFYEAWNSSGGFLSYDAQVKIAMGDWNGSAWDDRPTTYAVGLLFRAKNPGQQESFYGISFVRTNCGNGKNSDGIKDTMVPGGCGSANENQAMVMLWTRNSNVGNGDDNWLAYQMLDETNYTDYVVNGPNGIIKPWSTLLVRVVEAASVKLSNVTSPTGIVSITDVDGRSAKVIREIKDSDGKIVLLLNKVEGGFIRPLSINGHTTDSSWGYRPKDVYIWAFYGDTNNHSSNITPLKTIAELRSGNPRTASTSTTDTSYPLNWLPTDIQEWSTEDDHFTLVQWEYSLNTSQDSTIHRMGKDKELNGIIRTKKWVTEDSSYTANNFPPEFGLNALGDNATQVYYDNIGLYLYGLSNGGADGSGEVTQYP